MQSGRNVPPMPSAGQSPLPIDDQKYLREIAFTAQEAATTNDPRVRKLGAQLLAMQAPTLAAIANGMRTMTDEEKNLEGKNR